MLQSRKVTFSLIKYSAVLMLAVLLSGCAITFVKKYPKDKPFVYETNVKVQNAANNAEKKMLEERLVTQVDDSLRARRKEYPLWQTINTPPVFDTINIERSKAYMTALMKSLGYFASKIEDTHYFRKVKPVTIFKRAETQLRTTIDFIIIPGKNLKIDSVDFALATPEWQALVMQHRDESVLKKNGSYSKGIVAQELERVVNLLRNNGYYKVTKEDIYAEVDTVLAALIDPTLDPFEQLQLLEQLKQRNETPTIDVIIKQRIDTTHTRPYYIGKVTIYPDVPAAVDTFQVVRLDTFRIGNFQIITRSDQFRRRFLAQYSALKPGELYKQDNYFKTINTFNQLGAWQQANVDVFENLQKDSTLDVEITLYPAKKYTSVLDVELSRNNANTASADLVAVSNLFGLGFNAGIRNRNFTRQSVQTTTNARVGVELGASFFQTVQTSLSHNIYFPKIHGLWGVPISRKKLSTLDLARTFVTTNVAYTDRKDFFQLVSANLGFGWEWGRGNKAFLLRPVNVELTNLTESDSLINLQKRLPYLKYAFNDGLVSSLQFSWRWQKPVGNHFNSARVGVEAAGLIWGNIKEIDINWKLFRFVRIDGDYRHWIQYKKSALAFRFFGAYGIAYGDSSSTVKEKSLPFFKQYVAGGPNSMRAWQVRQLGWGSNIPTDDTSFRDRFGDIQLETNVEYRFQLGTLPGGIKVGSAVYVDMGNIWLRKTFGDPELKNAEFNLGRLGKDMAIGTGTGLRVDFNYFLIRLDYAYKIKDPQRKTDPGQWFYNWKLFNGQLQLGINYPF